MERKFLIVLCVTQDTPRGGELKCVSLVAAAGFEPASIGYEPSKETAPPCRDINSHFRFSFKKDSRLVSTLNSIFTTISTACTTIAGIWTSTATVVFLLPLENPGTSGRLNEIREAISLSLNLEALVMVTSLALHHSYPTAGRGPTSLWQSWRFQRESNPPLSRDRAAS